MSIPRTAYMVVLGLATLLLPAAAARAQTDYQADVRFAVEELERRCGRLIEQKKVDWPAVSKQFIEESKGVKTDQQHLLLLVRVVARLRDGHAAVRPLAKGKAVAPPAEFTQPRTGPGMFLCRIGEGIYVKNSFGAAQRAGLKPGMEVVQLDGRPAKTWFDQRIATLSDKTGFSTDQQAFYYACHWGLTAPPGTKLNVTAREVGGREVTRVIIYDRANFVPVGPAFAPDGLKGNNDVRHGLLKSGYGYVHIRRCPGNLPELIDAALADLNNPAGIILDFRANGGGGFDHEQFMGRFIPKGGAMRFVKAYRSAGPKPYGGPVVVIIDAGVRSAGETASGMFKEDGRAYMIGESATAGTSSGKTTIELPSQLFALYVSVSSNMGRFNKGAGIEGIGVPPHEVVEYDPKDLASSIDTLTRRAEELLKEYPQEKVPYRPKEFGWVK